MKPIVKLFVGIVALISIICGTFLYFNYYTSISLYHFILFVLIIWFTNNFIDTTTFSRDVNVGMVLPIAFVIMNTYGPFWVAVIISISSVKLDHRKEHYFYKFVFNRAMFIITGAASALTYQYFMVNQSVETILMAFAIASLVYYIVNNLLVLSVVSLASGSNSINEDSFSYVCNLFANIIISYFIGLLLWYSFQYYNIFVMLLIITFIYIIRHFIYANLHKLKIQKDLYKSTQELEYIKLKNTFFRNLSHEFKTPLNLIFSSIQLMERQTSKMSEENRKKMNNYIGISKQNSFRLLRLVNNLIDLTKFDSDSYKLNKRNIDIINLVKRVSFSVEDYVLAKGKVLEFNTSIKKLITACDPNQIERVLLNLLSNAVKFTDNGDTISVNIDKVKDNVIISVKDTGIGIEEEEQQNIFEDFKQISETLTRNFEGSGIGLSIVKAIIDMHEGDIKLESEKDIGSNFIIKLPIYTLEEEDVFQMEHLNDLVELEFSEI